MRTLVRYIKSKNSNTGAIVYHDERFDIDRITVGRATQSDIGLNDLSVSLNHAAISMGKGKKPVIKAISVSGFQVNGRLLKTADLQPGDVIEVGRWTLKVEKPADGFELILVVEKQGKGGSPSADLREKSKTTIEETGLGKRSWSWILFVAVMVLFLIVPAVGVMVPSVGKLLRASPVPSDGSWDSGTLALAHHIIGDQCEQCHEKPFRMVRDHACIECHKSTMAHADPDFYSLDTLTRTRCATCHKDHNGIDGMVRRDPGLCSNCHEDPDTTMPNAELLPAEDFTDLHPQFRITLTSYDDEKQEEVRERVSMDDKDLMVEKSNLIFPHDKHLKPEGIDSPSGTRQLSCVSCHKPEPGGARMEPINMVKHCKECHSLTFEIDDAVREVPHGKTREVLFVLEEYYAKRALEGGYIDNSAPEVVRKRRRPGERLSKDERREALEWASQKYLEVGEEIFRFRVCNVCHKVNKTEREDGLPSWEVVPVRLNQHWMRKAVFSHRSHETMTCEDCHDANKSDTSADVLIPAIDNCRQCHAGEDAHNQVESPCIECHKFHIQDEFRMGAIKADE
ncbi:MAG: FHA domain-containing protein [Chromatiales bacterium]|nr:FHA domain-containing protein [Chromatiales bacterium]